MQSYFSVSNRVAAGLALVFKEKLRFSDTFSHKTIERAHDPGPVTRILQGGLQADQRVREREGGDLLPRGDGRSHIDEGQLRVSEVGAGEEGR